jgi:pyridoxal biosynthesis lyase PdxS
MIKEIVESVTIPVMAKVRIGHFVEAQVSPPRHGIGIYAQLTADSSIDWY